VPGGVTYAAPSVISARREQRRRLVVLVLFAAGVLPRSAHAQMSISDLPARPSLYVEMFGNALVFCCSLNLEVPASDHLLVRVGTAAELFAERPYRTESVLMTMNGLIGTHGHYLELGAGLMRTTASDVATQAWHVRPTVDVGFRTYSHGTIHRITLTPPLPPFDGSRAGRPWSAARFGVSIGRTF